MLLCNDVVGALAPVITVAAVEVAGVLVVVVVAVTAKYCLLDVSVSSFSWIFLGFLLYILITIGLVLLVLFVSKQSSTGHRRIPASRKCTRLL